MASKIPSPGQMLPAAFYMRQEVTEIAIELLGKILFTRFDGMQTSGRIVETEAYAGVMDRASHAYGGRNTLRTAVFYREGGCAYVYLCYGIHQMFNIITGPEGLAHAVLIRAVEPVQGTEFMYKRFETKPPVSPAFLGRGPGNTGRALGFRTTHTGMQVTGPEIAVYDDGYTVTDPGISPRIGVDYAGEDALLPYRYYIRGNPSVSGKKALRI